MTRGTDLPYQHSPTLDQVFHGLGNSRLRISRSTIS